MTATTLTAVPATLFAIVATYQVRENYNLDDPKGAPYWKNKGASEVVSHEGMTLDALNALSLEEKEAMVLADTPESDEYYAYDLHDWEIITLNSALVEDVRALLAENGGDIGYAKFSCEHGEYAFDWACRQEPAMLEAHRNSWNGWEVDRILQIQAVAV